MSYRVTVFCSANSNLEAGFFLAAAELAKGLVSRKWELVYGGARVGLMGHFADEMKKRGGVVRGAITEDLARNREVPHPGLDELVFVRDLFDRKRYLMETADAFVIFPGGFGTLDEALEVITWKALGAHQKPIVFVNLDGFWQSQLDAFQGFAQRGMIRAGGLELFEVTDNIEGVWKILDAESRPDFR